MSPLIDPPLRTKQLSSPFLPRLFPDLWPLFHSERSRQVRRRFRIDFLEPLRFGFRGRQVIFRFGRSGRTGRSEGLAPEKRRGRGGGEGDGETRGGRTEKQF